MRRIVSAAGRGPAGRRRRSAVASPLLAVGLLLAAGAAGEARAGWGDGGPEADAVLSPVVPAVRPSGFLAGLPGIGPRPLLMSRGPKVAALVPPLAPEGLALGPIAAAEVNSPIISGLPWRSGASCGDASFAAWRGRALDVNVTFVKHQTWQESFGFLSTAYYRGMAQQSPQLVTSLALLPYESKKQHAACAAGAYDGNFRYIGSLLNQAGAGQAIVRLGWEPNIGSGSHPWGIDTAGEIPAYIGCFQRAVSALRSTAPGLKIEWTNAKKGKLPVSVLAAYPGDASVDLFGVHYYDNDPAMPTQEAWDALLNAPRKNVGGPHGLALWLNTALAYGKKLGVSEWGVWRKASNPRPDNPTYVENMYRFFQAHAGTIAYENYYNCPNSHKIYPGSLFPQASATYQRLWYAGQ